MDFRMIAVMGAFDENGVYGIGPHMPWEDERGRSGIRYDMGRFVLITKDIAPKGKKNVLVVGRSTAEAMKMLPLPGRYMFVLSRTLKEEEVNAGRGKNEKLYIVRNALHAIEAARALEDSGHVIFAGGREVWIQALQSGICTHAFTTVVKCNAVERSLYKGEIREAPEMLRGETFCGMKLECSTSMVDTWGDKEVELEFRNYART